LIHGQTIKILIDERLEFVWFKHDLVGLFKLFTGHPYWCHTVTLHPRDIEFDGSTFFGSSHDIDRRINRTCSDIRKIIPKSRDSYSIHAPHIAWKLALIITAIGAFSIIVVVI
jgi:hypothetical protein